jgi:hypothetical protein
MDALAKDLLQQLECPVCMEYMVSPITMCKKGHNICNNCRSILKKCPTCRQHLNIRNVSLENMARDILHPCIYRDSGCKEVGFQGLISEHQAECPYGTHKCPFAKLANENCKWEGLLADVKSHIVSDHNTFITVVDGKQLIVCTNYTYYRALFALGEVFFYFSRLQGDMFYACVLYVGSKEKAKQFSYRIKLANPETQQCMSMTQRTRSVLENIHDIFVNVNCPGFRHNFVMSCTRVFKGLPVQVKISSIDG